MMAPGAILFHPALVLLVAGIVFICYGGWNIPIGIVLLVLAWVVRQWQLARAAEGKSTYLWGAPFERRDD
jgi:hypothetical protein